MQPTTFLPGHWRFQCVMVVGADFDGKMKWTLAYAGTSTGTSERMLQSNWNLLEGAAELSRIDYAKVPQRRLPQSRADGARARRDGAAEQSAHADGRAQRRAESVWQRARRGLAARQGAGRRMEDVEGSRHGDLHHSRLGEHEGDVLRAGPLRARADRQPIPSSPNARASTSRWVRPPSSSPRGHRQTRSTTDLHLGLQDYVAARRAGSLHRAFLRRMRFNSRVGVEGRRATQALVGSDRPRRSKDPGLRRRPSIGAQA